MSKYSSSKKLNRSDREEIEEEEEEDEEELGFSRNYFLSKELHGSAGLKKSARKLSDIDLVDEQTLRAAASGIPGKHEKEIASLLRSYKNLYHNWLVELRCGFGLLMYGFGSKKFLLEDFASIALTAYGVVVINGYLPSVNMKQVAVTTAELLQEQEKATRKHSSGNKSKVQEFSSQNMEHVFSFLNRPDSDENDCFVCVVVHNIDGPALRDSESQQYLAQMACSSHVRMIASMDHVNTTLLWNKKMVHMQFNWLWYHVPTYQSYKVEGIFYPLILASGTAPQTTRTALIVLQSLTPNAQSVFKVLAEYQLANPKEEGMPVNTLYTTSRELFLVSSQITLNSHLTEFKDHELVKTRRHLDGQDCLYIPLTSEALEKLLRELN